MTDGECGVPEDWRRRWVERRSKLGITSLGLLVDADAARASSLSSVCDRFWGGSLSEDAGALDLVFDAVV